MTNLLERAEIRKETFYKLTNSADVPTAPSEGGRNLYALSKNSPIGSNHINEFSQNISTGEISFKVTGQDPFFGAQANKDETIGTWRGIKIPIKTGQCIAVELTNELFIKNYVSYFGEDDRAVKNFKNYQASKFLIPADELEGVSYVTFRFGIKENTQPIGSIHSTKVKVEYGNAYTEWAAAPEDLGWSTGTLVPTQANRYLWKFDYVYYSDGSVEVTQPVNISIAGADGTNGQTSHVHFAFADDATGSGFSLTTPKEYMGWYADFNESASNDPTKYNWSKWKGDEGAPGKPGADGKTSYFHMAYADSADGKTGFSFTESGQQYQGYYTDFTQSSSTDPTKYTWMDRRAGIEVGSNNLLRKTAVNTENLKLFGKTDTTVSVVEKDGHQVYKLVVSGSSNAGAFFTSNNDYYNLIKDRNYTFSFWVLTNKDKYYNINSLGHIQAVNTNGDNVGNDILHQHTQPVYSTNVIKANTWTKVWCTFKATSNSYFKPYFWYLTAGDEIYIYDMMLNEGTVPLSHSLAPEDTQEQIDSKADSVLTQEQLNALAEKNNIVKAEMEAKASIDTVNQWITAYQNYVNANDADKAKSEQALKDASERILGIRYEVDNLKVVWDAIDTYMSFQNEGLVIGKKDGSAYAKFSDDRISLFSGSSEVMYISQGTLNIANGIFTKTIQIGRFRFETHPADADMLVVRFVGG
ncbi:hypothetical protein Si087_00163 [Streptococcus infantarius subsp. infantarius]|nr:hypothetical protein [Streptococcus infantarius subsp. infantarius]